LAHSVYFVCLRRKAAAAATEIELNRNATIYICEEHLKIIMRNERRKRGRITDGNKAVKEIRKRRIQN
jgi:hypothetical protein